MSGITTKGLNATQLEELGRYVFSDNKMYHFTPHLMGMWLDSMFLGILLALSVRWQVNVAATDKKWVKGIVYFLIIVHLGMSAHTLAFQIHNFVIGFGEYRSFLAPNWARPSYVFKALSRLPCSAFFTHRAWMMWKKNWAIPVCIVPMFVASAVCAIGVTVVYDSLPLPIVGQKLVWAMGSLELATDVSLTTLLVIALMKSKTGFKQTDKLISRFLRSVVETQLPPTINAAAFLAVTVELGNTSQVTYWLAGPKIYPICLLIVISSRVSMQTQHGSSGAYMQDSIELVSTTDTVKPNHIRVDRHTETMITQTLELPSTQMQTQTQNRTQARRATRGPPSISDLSDDSAEKDKSEPYARDANAWA